MPNHLSGRRRAPASAITRASALGLLGSAAVAACGGGGPDSVAVGSKNFTEELVLGEMYAQLLEHARLRVARKLDLGGTQVAMEALQRGDIDLYPEYTGTALITVLKLPPAPDAAANYRTVASAYRTKYDLVWLAAAPMNDTQALATTQTIARRYRLATLSDLSRAASQLRLGAIPEFTKREDGLPGLQRAYGGFAFKDVKLFDIGLKYQALLSGDVDVVVAFGTDGQIASDNLVVFVDDKHFWPAYQVAPVVRAKTLAAHPTIATELDKLAPLLTDGVMRALNARVDGDLQEPADVARSFLGSHGLA
jgi:osmoprotectant transport system substrate-binding protein